MRARERQELQEKSKARIANWPNTMHAMRRKREEERIARLEEEELERRRIDAMEYELQQQTRLRVVEKANKAAYEGSDQVKAFNSKLLMSDVLAEREVQAALKKRKAEHERRLNQEWEELDIAKMEAFDEKVKEKLVKEYERKMQNSKVISDQLHEFKMKYIKRMQDDLLEAELIARQVNEELHRESEKDQERKNKQLQMKEVFKKANHDLISQ
jgi:Trichohyalin-plectin-homology domain